MGRDDRARLEDVLRLAQQIAAQLEPLMRTTDEQIALCMRLAQAHAFGLVDQLQEIASAGADATTARQGDPAHPC